MSRTSVSSRFMKTVGTQGAVLGAALTVPRLVMHGLGVERDLFWSATLSLTGPWPRVGRADAVDGGAL
jgi:hypothetical protein